MIFDTHAHYDDEAFDDDREALLGSLASQGIQAVTNVAASLKSCETTLALTEQYPFIYGAIGVHPSETAELDEDERIITIADGSDTGIVNNQVPEADIIRYKDSTYEIVSKIAYLIGVPKRIFENEHEPPKTEVYERLEQDKAARIIRHLCIIRTAIERNFKHINEKMRFDYTSIYNLPEYIPPDSMTQLSADGVNFVRKSSKKLCHHVIEINKLIADRINNC